MKDFFISYNSADRSWAEWIAWVLEENGYSVVIQAWDFRPGGNFILDMQRATAGAERTVMVLSDAYLQAIYTQPEWAAAFQQDPTASDRKLLPVRIALCQPTGILASLVYVDLVGKPESEAERLLLDGLKDRGKSATRPTYPKSISEQERISPATVAFPAQSSPRSILKPGAPFPRVRLPENYVVRLDALKAVKEKLIAKNDRTLVVSAISGLGGLGKSVVATALVLDGEVQARFSDGILWVTLGQNPDLQTIIGDWIRELDKSREAFSANTLESASRYLHNLLAEKQVLLVVDDVWNAAHADWFRVGGAGCRMLVTTREAQIEGAEYYPLDLMTEAEAVDLVRRKLDQQWQLQQEAEVKAFARVLGYLPLALDLAANQVKDGFTWAELQSEFEVERQAVALEVLDSSEAWERLDEEQQRQYSLRACFNLSLRRLKPEQLRQFVWLGVLPEDMNVIAQVAEVLWDVRPLKAKKALIDLRQRSFLTDGVTTFEGELTYRVHDLMHDMARNLIEEGVLEIQNPGSEIQNLPLAHRQFLERYRDRVTDQRWDRLPNDGYIHRHLTWHMEQADWADEVHALIAMSDDQGRNAWFEACDRIGQPSIFVGDVARVWVLAKKGNKLGAAGSIVLQCRCALVAATLNSLVANLPIGIMAEFVKRDFWTVEQAWAYVEQMQDEKKLVEAIQVLVPYLSESLFQVVVLAARAIQGETSRASVLCDLAKTDGVYFTEALLAARAIQDEISRAFVLCDLAKTDGADFAALVEAARAIEDETSRASILRDLAKTDGADFAALMEATWVIEDETSRASVLSDLAKTDGADFAALMEATWVIEDETSRASVLSDLAKIDGADFAALMEAAWAIRDESSRASVLSDLAKIDGVCFTEALLAARLIQNEDERAHALSDLAKIDGACFTEALLAARLIQNEDERAHALSDLAKIDGAYFTEALLAARAIRYESRQSYVLIELAKIDGANFAALMEAAWAIQDETSRASVLSDLAKIEGADFAALIEAAWAIQDETSRASVLLALTKIDGVYFTEALAAARAIQNEDGRAHFLRKLAKIDGAYFTEALLAARAIRYESRQLYALIELAKIDGADFAALLLAVRAIQDESSRASVLGELTKIDEAYFTEALLAARAIQDEYRRASVLSALAVIDATYFTEALLAARAIQDEYRRASVLSALAAIDATYFTEALAAARAIQDESSRASVLCELAKTDGADFTALMALARGIQDETSRASVLCALATIDTADFAALLTVREIQDETSRASVLCALAKTDRADFSGVLAAARAMWDESRQASVLRVLAKDGASFSGVLAAAQAIRNETSRASVLCELTKVDAASFTALLAAARAIWDESSRASVLCELAKIDAVYFTEALVAARAIQNETSRASALYELAKMDVAYFTEALAAARAIQDETSRASVLCDLAKMDVAYFTEALAAARAIQDESRRASVLCDLAKTDGVDFAALMVSVQMIQDESMRASVLSDLTQHAPQDFLPILWNAIFALTHKPTGARALSQSLPRFLLTGLLHSDWQSSIYLLACRKRSDLMQDLVTLYPVILDLGGETAMRGVVDAMCEVCSQWQ